MEGNLVPAPKLPVYEGLVMPAFPTLTADTSGLITKIRELESRDSDILVCAYPKSGSHWVAEIVEQLTAGNAEYSPNPKGGAFLEAADFDKIEQLKTMTSPRNFNTHLPFRMLPRKHIELKAKVIRVIRNPKDIAVSAYHHFLKDVTAGSFGISWEDFFSRFYKGDVPYGAWFVYEKDWERVKETTDLNILTLYYETLKLNTEEEIKRIADFLKVNYTEELIKQISEKVDFKNMSKGKCDISGMFSVDQKPFVYRKGEIGDWKNWFTLAQNEMFDELYAKEMKDSSLKIVFTT